jgi:hypothetical protein
MKVEESKYLVDPGEDPYLELLSQNLINPVINMVYILLICTLFENPKMVSARYFIIIINWSKVDKSS